MSAVAAEACRIVARIREKELKEVWSRDLEGNIESQTDEILYPGVMFNVAKERMEKTLLWKIVERMPKGAPMFFIHSLLCHGMAPPHWRSFR
jgi:adenosine deaminase CECR1